MSKKNLCFLVNGKDLIEMEDSNLATFLTYDILEVSKILETAPSQYVLDSRIFCPPILERESICPISEYFFFDIALFQDSHIEAIFKGRESDVHYIRISKKEFQHLRAMNDMIKTYQRSDEESRYLIISNLLKNNVLHLKHTFEKQKSWRMDDTEVNMVSVTYVNIADKFKKLVSLHSTRHKGIHFYAESLNITVRTLSSVTKKVLNCTPKEIIDGFIMDLGKKMLEDPLLSIKVISQKLGFISPNGFCMYFKKIYGNPPSTYRKWMLGDQPHL